MREELGVPGFLAKAGLCEVAECSVTAGLHCFNVSRQLV